MHAENAFRGSVVDVEPDVLEVHALALDRDNCLRYPRRWYHPRTMKKLLPAGRRSPQQAPPRTRLAADIGGTFTDQAVHAGDARARPRGAFSLNGSLE